MFKPFEIIGQGIKYLPEEKFGGTEQERLEAFEKDAKSTGKVPHRSFNFDTKKLIEQD
jgi:hypothetical protein